MLNFWTDINGMQRSGKALFMGFDGQFAPERLDPDLPA